MERKVAIVTGGAGGLGSEICCKFSARDVAVAVADMNAEAAHEVATSIDDDGSRAIAVQVEVTDEDSVVSAVRTVVDRLGRVDYLVHCAGTNIKAPVLDMPLDMWNLSLQAHLTGAFLFCREAGRQMVAQRDGGSVVLMSSLRRWRRCLNAAPMVRQRRRSSTLPDNSALSGRPTASM